MPVLAFVGEERAILPSRQKLSVKNVYLDYAQTL